MWLCVCVRIYCVLSSTLRNSEIKSEWGVLERSSVWEDNEFLFQLLGHIEMRCLWAVVTCWVILWSLSALLTLGQKLFKYLNVWRFLGKIGHIGHWLSFLLKGTVTTCYASSLNNCWLFCSVYLVQDMRCPTPV